MIHHIRFARSRREFIAESAAGFGGLALSFLLQQDLLRADASRIVSPLDPKKPPLPAKAKSVIFLFQAGGPSQMDTFDPKPLLNKLEGQPLPKTFGPIRSQFLKRTRASSALGAPSRSTDNRELMSPTCFPTCLSVLTTWPSSALATATSSCIRPRSIR